MIVGMLGPEAWEEGWSSHSLVVGLRWPVMTVLPSRVITADLLAKVAVHPLSHSCSMDIREPDARDGKMWASFAAEDKFSSWRFAVCAAWILSWLGRRTLMPLVTGRMSGYGCSLRGVGWDEKKWGVAPVSRTTLLQECWVCTNV